MVVLGLDTCLNACSVAVVRDGETLAYISEVMARGHQERLAPMAQLAMARAGLSFDDLDRVGVTVGPGSFTGLRVGLAFAKGLGAALQVPVVAVGALEALGAEAEGLAFAVIDARREQIYVQGFEDGRALMAPDALPLGIAAARIVELSNGRPFALVGSGAALLAEVSSQARPIAAEGADARVVARLAAARTPTPPRPLYLRAPDAKPSIRVSPT